jgi:hypothetical protein
MPPSASDPTTQTHEANHSLKIANGFCSITSPDEAVRGYDHPQAQAPED